MRLSLAVVVVLGLATRAYAEDAPERLGAAYRAYDAGDLAAAKTALTGVDDARLGPVRDHVLWLQGMVALRTGDFDSAAKAFDALRDVSGTPFAREVPWRLADVAWAKGDREAAARAYGKLITGETAGEIGDVGTAKFRIAETKSGKAALAAYRAMALEHPSHPLAPRALQKLATLGAPALTNADHLERAKNLSNAHLWDEAIAEFSLLPEKLPKELGLQRDYWMATTLFKMRRRYGEAGVKLLDIYQDMGGSAAEAMFHGARALSRADRDDDAIRWYRRVVEKYPRSEYAKEAAYLAGWLELNRGKYKEAIAPLEDSLRRYPTSKWVDDALWSLGMAHYFLGEWDKAQGRLEALAKRGGSLEGGKGMYWLARIAQRLDKNDDAVAGYRATIARYPFSWYALLSHARLAGLKQDVPPFGVADPKPRGPKLAAKIDPKLEGDRLIQRVDILTAAGLGVEAGQELARGEGAFLKRNDRGAAFAMLLDRYRKAGNFNRPWLLAVSYSGSALDGPPEDDARRWWENAFPRAYRDLIEKYQALGKNPEDYLYSIMRKESGFNPHDLSYADAQGLLQMIPATTRRVAKALGIPYDAGRLYEPEYNIQTGSWYIGHVLQKFKGQIPLGAGSFNSGPRPVMRWIDQYGDREIDELVELVPYTQTREYMKKVTENYARYRFLYAGEVYKQPLTVDKQYLDDRITY